MPPRSLFFEVFYKEIADVFVDHAGAHPIRWPLSKLFSTFLGLTHSTGEPRNKEIYRKMKNGQENEEVQRFNAMRKEAEEKDAKAQLNLGKKYYEGKGVPKNYVEAYAWFLLAKANGDEEVASKWFPPLKSIFRAALCEDLGFGFG